MTELEFNQMKKEADYIVLKSEGLSGIWVHTMNYLKGAKIPIDFFSYDLHRRQIKIKHPANYFSDNLYDDFWFILPEDISEVIYKNIKIQGAYFI